MKFKKLDINDKKLFEKYIKPYNFYSCEYSFATLYIWRKICDIEYTLYKGALIIKKRDFEGNYYFMQPLGYNKDDIRDIIKKLIEYKIKYNMKYLFKDLEKEFVQALEDFYKDINKFFIEEDRNDFDYIYDAKQLMKLSGKKYHKKKNHYNSFIKKYKYKICDIDNDIVKKDVIYLAEKWYDENGKKYKHFIELECIKETLYKLNELNLRGIAIYVNENIVGFSIGEKLNKNMAIIHFEKGDKDIKGVYTFIVKTFIDKYFSDVKIINRQEDMGIQGLRKSKMSYHPIRLQKKFIFDFY